MTYIASLHPANPSTVAHEERVEFFDVNFPGWDTRDRFVSEDDVLDSERGIVWGYGGNHRVYLPGAHE